MHIILLLFLLWPTVLFAQDLSIFKHSVELPGKATLRTGWQLKDGRYMMALDMVLAPNWKTYWRAPGSYGIAPEFNWTKSRNLKQATILWPRPAIFMSQGMQSLGFHDRMILPIEITPENRDEPVMINLTMTYGLCKELCIPAELSQTARLSGPGGPDPVISAALAQMPVSARNAGQTPPICHLSPTKHGHHLQAVLTTPPPMGEEAVSLELPDIWLSDPILRREGEKLVISADIAGEQGHPPALDKLRMTHITAQQAVEMIGCSAP